MNRAGLIARRQSTLREAILSPELKRFLERFWVGRAGLRLGRAIRLIASKMRDPIRQRIWARQFILPLRNLATLNRPLTTSLNGIQILLTPQGTVAGDLWVGLRRERSEESLALSILEPAMICFDIGAGPGLFSIPAAKKIGGNGVFAFEPSASTCDLFRRNLHLNHLSDIHVEQIGLGDSASNSTVQRACWSNCPGSLGFASRMNCPAGMETSARITTVDAFMKEQDIPRVDLLKLDVDGAELIVLHGARRLLERADAPGILYKGYGFLTRRFGYHPVEVLWLLDSYGYTLFTLNCDTGATSELKAEYQYNSVVIAAKPGHPSYAKLRERLQ